MNKTIKIVLAVVCYLLALVIVDTGVGMGGSSFGYVFLAAAAGLTGWAFESRKVFAITCYVLGAIMFIAGQNLYGLLVVAIGAPFHGFTWKQWAVFFGSGIAAFALARNRS